MEAKHSDIIGLLGRSSSEEVRSALDGLLKGCVRSMVVDVLQAEVEALCGPRYARQEGAGEYRRAGTADGAFTYGARTEKITRPRVRRKGPDGRETEASLESYAAAKDESSLREALFRSLCAGVSSRDQASVHPEAKHTSRSQVSRLWVERGEQFWRQLRGRDLSKDAWLALMLDGIYLSSELTAVVALGTTTAGRKVIRDLELGSSESFEGCRGLLGRIKGRGFTSAAKRLLVVTDGGKGLRRAVKQCFRQVVLQRCLIHKERNIKARLSRRHYGELARLFKGLRNAQGLADAEAALQDLRAFLEKRCKGALESLDEAGEELLAFHSLNAPSTLNRTFLSTNIIENSFRNVRAKIGRVKRWRPETDQPQRWLAYALRTAEKGFRRITGHRDLDALMAALNRAPEAPERPITEPEEIDKEVAVA